MVITNSGTADVEVTGITIKTNVAANTFTLGGATGSGTIHADSGEGVTVTLAPTDTVAALAASNVVLTVAYSTPAGTSSDVTVSVAITDKTDISDKITAPDAGTYTYSGSVQGPAHSGNVTLDDGSTVNVENSYKGRGGTTYGPSTTKPTDAGTYTLTVQVPSANADYKGSDTVDFAINPKSVSLPTGAYFTKVYDGDNTTLMAVDVQNGAGVSLMQDAAASKLDGVVSGEDGLYLSAIANGAGTFNAADVADCESFTVSDASKMTLAAITGGTDGSNPKNYAFTTSAQSAKLTPKALTLGAATLSKKYDAMEDIVSVGEVTPNNNGTYTFVKSGTGAEDDPYLITVTDTTIGSQNVKLTAITGKYDQKDHTAANVAVSGYTLTDGTAKGGNYVINGTATPTEKVSASNTLNLTGSITKGDPTIKITNLNQTVSSASSVAALTAEVSPVDATAAPVIEYYLPYNDVVVTAANCDCGAVEKSAHTEDCPFATSSGVTPCICGAGDGVAYGTKHTAACDYGKTGGNLDADCNCTVRSGSTLTNAVDHAAAGCAAVVSTAQNDWFKSGDVITGTTQTALEYIKAQSGNQTYLVRASMVATTDLNAITACADTNPDNASAGNTVTEAANKAMKMTVTIDSGSHSSGGGGGSSSYTVKFDAGKNGKITKGNASTSVSSGSKVAASKVPEITANDGYKFLGWSLDGKKTVDPTEQKITKSVTFTALYAEEAVLNKEDHMAYIKGYENGTFRPGNNITRAEVAAIFSRILKNSTDVAGSSASSFTDVAATAWYAPYVTVMEQQGLLNGYSDGTFRPEAPITREEFTAMATRVVGVTKAGELPFSDVKSDRWSIDNIFTAYENGWIRGYEDGTFRPEAKLTRAEAVKMVNAMLERTITSESVDGASYNTFSDVASSHWAYYDVIEASNAHQYTKEDGKETWTK